MQTGITTITTDFHYFRIVSMKKPSRITSPGRLTTLAALCKALECQPGDLLRWEPDAVDDGSEPVKHPVQA